MSTITPTQARPALTLIETLVALVLLSGVAIATAALLHSVSDVHTKVTPELRWMSHAERTLMCVADDLLIGDRLDPQPPATGVDGAFVLVSRAEIDGNAPTRARIRYHLDGGSGTLTRTVQALDDRGRPRGVVASRTLLGGVDSFVIEPIERPDEQHRRQANQPPVAYRLKLRSGDLTISRVVRP